MNFIFASSNQHKAKEFSELFGNSGISVQAAPKSIEVAETGQTYFENAYLKASEYFKLVNAPVFADDSGLNVTALPNELGLQTAYFGGGQLDQAQKNLLLLSKMKGFEGAEARGATFVCVLCFYLSKEEVYFFEGRMKGSIGLLAQGTEGFGYDPTFIPEGETKTLSSLPDWKMSHSHRALAVKEALKFLRQRIVKTGN